ncbi:MAG: c-type cytochrome domain-containing protein [Bacteroidota bacterium]
MLLLDTFLGRFHPLMVHLPIGFLILGILIEWFYRSDNAQRFVAFAWLMGGVSAVAAAGLGWMLANEGGYNEDTLFWHRWLGVGLAVVCFGVYAVKSGRLEMGKIGHQVLNVGTLLLLGVVGHLGGNMTHGSTYLTEHAPKPIKAMLGEEEVVEVSKTIDKEVDSIYVYADIVKPIFAAKCMDCHNDEVQRGGLNMATFEQMAEGGDHGAVFLAGDATESELFRRVTLMPDHAKYMPLKGEPMSFQEIRLLEWWLDGDASEEMKIKAKEVQPSIASILEKDYGVDLTEKPYFEKVQVEKVSDQVIADLEAAGFQVDYLMANNGWLEVVATQDEYDNLDALIAAKEQITWLELDNVNLTDEQLLPLAQLENLTRLRLQNNPITGTGLTNLTNLKRLTSINLHHTQVDDTAIEQLSKIANLKRAYLWETQVTPQGADELRKARPGMDVDMGFVFAEVQQVE